MDSAMCQIFLQVRNMWSLLNLGTSKGVILSREASDKKQVHEMLCRRLKQEKLFVLHKHLPAVWRNNPQHWQRLLQIGRTQKPKWNVFSSSTACMFRVIPKCQSKNSA